jgi:protein translocase SecG subunit
MEVIQTILYVLIIVSSIILILLTLAQSNKGSDLGLFGGSTEMVFGSQKGNILTRTTAILATIVIAGTFFMGALKVYVSRDRLELEKKAQQQEVKTLEDIQKEQPADKKEEAPSEEKNQAEQKEK